MAKYEYLLDNNFLQQIDTSNIQELHSRLNIKNFNNEFVGSIEGKATGGNLSINGNSAVRRTGNISMVIDDSLYNITSVDNLISINKYVELEIGIENTYNFNIKYKKYKILWFPLGTFIISQPSISNSINGLTLNLQLKDKMAMLNGECGGALTNAITHSPILIEEYNEEKAENNIVKEYPLFRSLIYTLVSELGQIPKNQIVIDNLDNRIKNLVTWNDENRISIALINGAPPMIKPAEPEDLISYGFGDIIGYVFTDFTYPAKDELTSNPGESVASVLEKIKNILGNFEYFFDTEGIFHFQMIQDFINEGSQFDDLAKAINDKYFININQGTRSIYTFNDKNLSTAYTNSPQYNKIKNDIVFWGEKTETKTPIRYHVAIDRPPSPPNGTCSYLVLPYEDSLGITRLKVKTPLQENLEGYQLIEFTETDELDWRVYAYLQYKLDKNRNEKFYSKELDEELPKIYDFSLDENGKFKGYKSKTQFDYYLDLINPDDLKDLNIKAFDVEHIGLRSYSKVDNAINAIIPNNNYFNYVYIHEDNKAEEEEAKEMGVLETDIVKVPNSIFDKLTVDMQENTAYDAIRSVLHEVINYTESISISTIPVYHLEPNTRITVNNRDSGIYGDYVVKSLSIPLQVGGVMQISAVRAIERI